MGQSQAIILEATDMAAVHAELLSKGVVFVSGSEVQPWRTFAIIDDSEKNRLILVEQPKG